MAVAQHNQGIVDEFRANQSKVGGQFEGVPLLLLTTTGAKTGRSYTNPMMYLRDGDRLIVFASKSGAPTNPDWFHNLVAHPNAVAEVGKERFPVRATVLEGEERDRLFDQQASRYPGFREYQQKTTRKIPVIALERTS